MGRYRLRPAHRAAMRARSKGQNAAIPFVGAYDAIPNLVHVYEPARCTLSAYTGGALLRLRRDSDDEEADFSHVSAFDPELNIAAIAAWLGASPGYIVSVYDQVSGDTITNAAEAGQPLFVASIQNGHAGAQWAGGSQLLRGTFTIGGAVSQPDTIYSVAALDAAVADNDAYLYLFDGVAANRQALMKRGVPSPAVDRWSIFGATAEVVGGAADALWSVWAAIFNGASSQFWRNGVSQATGDPGASTLGGFTMGDRTTNGRAWVGPIVSLSVCSGAHTDAQRNAMEAAMNTYWGVY